MKNSIVLINLVFILVLSCKTDNETYNLDTFLKSFSIDIKDYKVICFVPIDGCSTCIDPSLKYSRVAKSGFLLVMSSLYKKNINFTIERIKFLHSNYISDFHNFSVKKGFVTERAPCFYFLKEGTIVKKVDLSTTYDKESILKEIEIYLN